jgi:hypothetical protein
MKDIYFGDSQKPNNLNSLCNNGIYKVKNGETPDFNGP